MGFGWKHGLLEAFPFAAAAAAYSLKGGGKTPDSNTIIENADQLELTKG